MGGEGERGYPATHVDRVRPLVWSRRYGAGIAEGHRSGNYSDPQAGMLTVIATLPRVPRSGCPSR
ncbi:hypothetical protein FGG36_gp68 [Mycobacterium phage Jeffabunny]|uniref:Uncharacterized protein n=4 Tax=Gladiatorvirus TaxID=2948726 RepID=V5R4H0_9CAUD|nr:hypothetical protein X820_gp079 [Mycobacterium phage CloudWang3]YP_008858460.1 hypothetical protein X828_gp078 [Mycobacterium phage Artemis2UCLA]YP_008859143.1 hypothetical protein X821_gp077 [Mycobacterium phage Zaka]YP_009636551.1 hypothetical protein FGG22_gp080 [Mycobacterium phage Hammer]YP_009638207.1 hypothetical protein FGG36_gp68 [Mycobacterium phage Jeffabunny]AYD84919.1 hypothetical protein SEA_ZULU_36 [Mycobacterium phage Zulu]QAY14272.1 hypothetical protein SEA_HEXAMO_36 [Myco